MENRIHNSEHVGSSLRSALKLIQAEKQQKGELRKAAALNVPEIEIPINRNKLPIRVAMKRRKLVARGSGVYEDSASGDIWFRDGEYLVRQAIDVESIVNKYLNSCKE